MMTITSRSDHGIDEVAGQIVSDIEALLKTEMQYLAGEARKELRAGDHIAGGELRRSVQADVEPLSGGLAGWVGFEQYGLYLEFGTRPHWPPLAPLVRWVRTKGLVTRQERFANVKRGPHLASALSHDKASAAAVLADGTASRKQQRAAALYNAMGSGKSLSESSKHLRAVEAEELKVARAVQFGIARHGTPEHPWLSTALERWFPRVIAALDRLLGGRR